ncbi:MAG: segregation/condensation protein A [Acidimicrobiales bacterium]
MNLSEIVDAYLVELDRMERLDLEVATEFLLIAATLVELKTRRLLPDDREIEGSRRRARSVGGARDPPPGPPHRVQDLQGRNGTVDPSAQCGGASYACRWARSRSVSLACRICRGHDPEHLRDYAYLRATAPKPVVRSDLRTSPSIKITVAEAVEELIDELFPGGPSVELPGAHRRPGRADRGRRPVPGRARAVQAGRGRARPTDHLFGDITVVDRRFPTRPAATCSRFDAAAIDTYEG